MNYFSCLNRTTLIKKILKAIHLEWKIHANLKKTDNFLENKKLILKDIQYFFAIENIPICQKKWEIHFGIELYHEKKYEVDISTISQLENQNNYNGIIILYSKSNTAYRYINTNYKQYMMHYAQYIIIAEHDINLKRITNLFSHIQILSKIVKFYNILNR
jgi:hypothetical protein